MELSESSLFGVRCAADIIRASRNAVILTGAGISTASGIPDFRSANTGIWEKFDPFEVASLSAFRYNPLQFYEWLRGLVGEIHRAQPNPAHFGIAELERMHVIKTVVTQNVDYLHQRAGSRRVLEVHGTMSTLTCTRCYQTFDSAPFIQPYLENGAAPYCPACGSILKPDLVLMGEQLPARIWLQAQQACKECDLMIVAGSSLEVLPVAGLPMRALENGAHLILINHSSTYLDVRADVVLREDLDKVIPRLVAEVKGESCSRPS